MKISPEMLERLGQMPDRHPGIQELVPTDEQIEILRLYYHRKTRDDLARLLGISPNTMRRWYRKYLEGEKT